MRTLPRGLQRIKHAILFRIRFLQTSRGRLFRADIFKFRYNFELPHVFMKGSKTLSKRVQPWGKLRETWADKKQLFEQQLKHCSRFLQKKVSWIRNLRKKLNGLLKIVAKTLFHVVSAPLGAPLAPQVAFWHEKCI